MSKIALVAAHAQLRERDAVLRTPHLMALADAMAGAGHEVTVHVRRADGRTGAEEDSSRGYRVVRYTGRAHTGVADVMRADRPDVVHAHGGAMWQAAAEVARELDVPFVYSVHAAADDPAAFRDHDPATDLAAAHAAERVLVSFSAQVRRLVADGIPRHKIDVVPYGVDVDHFTPDGAPAVRGRAANRIVTLGDVAPCSGFGTAVAALRALPDTELLIVGGPQRGTHAKEIREYARSLGVADRVRFAGAVSRADLPALLRSADILVCCPWEPMFGVPALEAMACGVAVVANRLGGLADTVVDDVTGRHVTPRKPRELAATLLRLLNHKAIREQQGAAGRDRAWARYSWPRVANETLNAYRRAGLVDPVALAR